MRLTSIPAPTHPFGLGCCDASRWISLHYEGWCSVMAFFRLGSRLRCRFLLPPFSVGGGWVRRLRGSRVSFFLLFFFSIAGDPQCFVDKTRALEPMEQYQLAALHAGCAALCDVIGSSSSKWGLVNIHKSGLPLKASGTRFGLSNGISSIRDASFSILAQRLVCPIYISLASIYDIQRLDIGSSYSFSILCPEPSVLTGV